MSEPSSPNKPKTVTVKWLVEIIQSLPATTISVPTKNYKESHEAIDQTLIDKHVLLEKITGVKTS